MPANDAQRFATLDLEGDVLVGLEVLRAGSAGRMKSGKWRAGGCPILFLRSPNFRKNPGFSAITSRKAV